MVGCEQTGIQISVFHMAPHLGLSTRHFLLGKGRVGFLAVMPSEQVPQVAGHKVYPDKRFCLLADPSSPDNTDPATSSKACGHLSRQIVELAIN